ncbi:beta galactosidase jelly roll domain-containing protein [Marivirga sp. S37H4]|uniref:Beta galactosidase jelly roll domain-containing protein n=1 Tax=Marivirga aurantiaca TaxID=2802615 RepID=A0A935CA87_9BACT|nr:beta galactosidase jelly roll domain-containing protein [Marivirga aurantiaca]MBK6266621.1 beta galactosidase jelly roll domain-containing protein [Marivirga aurantiaca]
MSNYKKTIFIFLLASLHCLVAGAQVKGDSKTEDNSIMSWIWELMMEEKKWDHPHYVNENVYQDVDLKRSIAGQWKFSIGDNLKWKSANYNDSNWEHILVPADWENEGFHGYDGYAWYRLHFDGRLLNPKDVNFLILGFIDDVDETYINGTLIGKSGQFPPRFRTAYNSNRKYYIPTSTINFGGDNVLAVRVYDDGANGGIVRGEMGFYTAKTHKGLLQHLYGVWKFNTQNEPNFYSEKIDDSCWEDILAPAYWDNHGYRAYDGIAWYRKNFQLDFKPDQNKRYYLILGKIDDFDETYLNGVKIGETIDGRAVGESRSYIKTRIYKIPQNLLRPTGNNIVAVKVTDIGIEGGIYKGPLGIVEEADLTNILRDN